MESESATESSLSRHTNSAASLATLAFRHLQDPGYTVSLKISVKQQSPTWGSKGGGAQTLSLRASFLREIGYLRMRRARATHASEHDHGTRGQLLYSCTRCFFYLRDVLSGGRRDVTVRMREQPLRPWNPARLPTSPSTSWTPATHRLFVTPGSLRPKRSWRARYTKERFLCIRVAGGAS